MTYSLPDDIPSLRDWLELPQWKGRLPGEIEELIGMIERHPNDDSYDMLLLAIDRDDREGAKKIMHTHGWKGNTLADPEAANWHKDASLVFYACWGNDKFIPLSYYKLLQFLIEEDPASLLSATPSGGSMLHATLNGQARPVIIKELLAAGVNPYRIDSHGKTYLDYMRDETQYMSTFPGYENDTDYLNNQKAIAMVEDFMKHHSREKCEAREASMRAEHQAISWVSRRKKNQDTGVPPL